MEPVSYLRDLILVVVAIMTVAIGLVLTDGHIDPARSISQHSVRRRSRFVIFGLASNAAGIGLYIFMRFWFIPTLGLPQAFGDVLALGLVLQGIAAWIPDYADTRWSSRLHQLLAFSMAWLMPVLVALLVFSSRLSGIAWLICALIFVAMAVYALLFIVLKRLRGQFLLHQSLYVALFYSAIIVATYLR